MNKNEKFFLLQKITSLSTYSELLPDEFQSNYISDINTLKKLVSDYKVTDDKVVVAKEQPKPIKEIFIQEISDENEEQSNAYNEKPALTPSLGADFKQKNNTEEVYTDDAESDLLQAKPLLTPKKGPVAPPKPIIGTGSSGQPSGFVNYMKSAPVPPPPTQPTAPSNQTPVKQEKKSTFEFVNAALIPKLTDEGKNMMGDLSFPIHLYLVIKLIDEKTTLLRLFEKYYKMHAVNYVDFANNLYELEQKRCISFIRTVDAPSRDAGLIKIEEFFSEGKIVSEANLAKAQETMRATGGMFISKTLMSMNIINESYLGQCMKIQKWASRIFDKSPYLREEAEVKTQDAKETTSSNLQQQLRSTLISQNTQLIQQEIESDDLGLMDFITPIFNEKGKEILSNPDFAELARRISIVKENESLFQNYLYNKETFKGSRLGFLKFISKLDSQDIFEYKANLDVEDKPIWCRLGQLLISLKLVNEEQLKEALDYKDENNTYIGEAFATLGFIEESVVDDCLKVQAWINRVLSSISYETAFVEVMKNVLMESFRCKVDIGNLKRVAFSDPLKNIVYIHYPISGKLSGTVYYISDRSFMNNLARTMMNSLGTEATELDESYVGTVSSVIITNSLSKLSQKGLFNPSEMAKILMEKEVKMEAETLIANGNRVDMIPLINQWGRFAICLETKEN